MPERPLPIHDQLPGFYQEAGLYGTHVYLPELLLNSSDLTLKYGNRYAVSIDDLLAAFDADPYEGNYKEGTFLMALDYLRREKVVKMMKGHQDPEYYHRFASVMALLQNIDDPHLVRVEAGTLLPSPSGEIYPTVIMPYYDGVSADRISEENGRIDPLRMADAIFQVGNGLNILHCHGIIHSDVAPKNILFLRGAFTRPHAVLNDFGASFVAKRNRLYPNPQIWSTPKYMAPELNIQGCTPTFAVDQYSLAVTAEEMLQMTSLSPFTSIVGLRVRDRLPQRIGNVIKKGSSIDPKKRFETVGEFGYELFDAVRKHVAHSS
jgi:serine/threonine-protein kinase